MPWKGGYNASCASEGCGTTSSTGLGHLTWSVQGSNRSALQPFLPDYRDVTVEQIIVSSEKIIGSAELLTERNLSYLPRTPVWQTWSLDWPKHTARAPQFSLCLEIGNSTGHRHPKHFLQWKRRSRSRKQGIILLICLE
jgi:hypothetical protein